MQQSGINQPRRRSDVLDQADKEGGMAHVVGFLTRRVEKEYARCVTALNRTGILTLLPKSQSIGVIGIDGK